MRKYGSYQSKLQFIYICQELLEIFVMNKDCCTSKFVKNRWNAFVLYNTIISNNIFLIIVWNVLLVRINTKSSIICYIILMYHFCFTYTFLNVYTTICVLVDNFVCYTFLQLVNIDDNNIHPMFHVKFGNMRF